MLIYSYKYLIESTKDPVLQNKLLKLFSETAIDICAGQQMDMDFESMEVVELGTYLLMIKFKTAVLLAACLKAGALIGGASDDDAEHLYAYGLNLGLAFQIQDDLLDLYADEKSFGKKTGGDIIQKKKTFLYLKALEIADDKQKLELIALYNQDAENENEKINSVKNIFNKLNIREQAKEMETELSENAEDHFNALSVDPEKLSLLKELSQLLLARKN